MNAKPNCARNIKHTLPLEPVAAIVVVAAMVDAAIMTDLVIVHFADCSDQIELSGTATCAPVGCMLQSRLQHAHAVHNMLWCCEQWLPLCDGAVHVPIGFNGK